MPRLEPLRYAKPSGVGSPSTQQHQGLFSSFVPAGATPREGQTTHSQRAQSQSGHAPEELGKAAGTGLGAMTGGELATAAQQYSTSNNRHTPVVDASSLVRARSRIHQAKPVPEIKPNLAAAGKQDQKQLNKTLQTVMNGMDEPRAPRAVRHLTQDDINEAAAVAYSENTEATVEAYEQIISAILNRVRSGNRQFVDPGQQFTVHNVVHSKSHGNQFQGVERPGRRVGTTGILLTTTRRSRKRRESRLKILRLTDPPTAQNSL